MEVGKEVGRSGIVFGIIIVGDGRIGEEFPSTPPGENFS